MRAPGRGSSGEVSRADQEATRERATAKEGGLSVGSSHDWGDLALGVAGVAGPILCFLVARYLGNVDAIRKEIRDLRADTANIRGEQHLPPFPYSDR